MSTTRKTTPKRQATKAAVPVSDGLTLRQAARLFGQPLATLHARLTAAGVDTTGRAALTVSQVHEALAKLGSARAEIERERLEQLRLANETARLELRRLEHELVPLEEALTKVREVVAPVAKAITGMPARLSARVNPADPVHARAELDAWAREICQTVQDRCRPKSTTTRAPGRRT